MRTAFLILAHEKPVRLATLVRVLDTPASGTFVHVDRRAPLPDFEGALADAGTTPELLLHEHAVVYSSHRMVDATLPLLRAAFENGYDYFVLLGGLDFPLVPVDEALAFLEEHRDRLFIRHDPIPTHKLAFEGRHRTELYSFIVGDRNETLFPFRGHGRTLSLRGKVLNTLLWLRNRGRVRRQFPYGMQPYYCSQWWNIHRRAAGRILDFLAARPGYYEYHRHALHPEEMFFQSIVLNDEELKPDVIDDDLRFIAWVEGRKHPRRVGPDDLEAARASGALFARKVVDEALPSLGAGGR